MLLYLFETAFCLKVVFYKGRYGSNRKIKKTGKGGSSHDNNKKFQRAENNGNADKIVEAIMTTKREKKISRAAEDFARQLLRIDAVLGCPINNEEISPYAKEIYFCTML